MYETQDKKQQQTTMFQKCPKNVSKFYLQKNNFMNIKDFDTTQLTTNYYLRILKAKSTINNSTKNKPTVSFTSRNETHMKRYQKDLNTNYLVKKLTQINDSHYQNLSKKHKNSKKNKKSCKNRKLTFSQNKSYQTRDKTLVNEFKLKQRKNQVHNFNINLMNKLINSQSTYKQAFSRERDHNLFSRSINLRKTSKQKKIRDNLFDTYENVKMMTISARPNPRAVQRKKRKSVKLQMQLTESTRPQTAK